jgi:lipid-A-disaccharide synthase
VRNILLVAAENSAEAYAAQVLDEFAARGGGYRFWGVGGDRLAARGFETVMHNRSLAVVGIVEVLAHLGRIHRLMRRLLRLARERRADAALLIDFPDFNLRLARRLRRAGIPVFYYVSPTVWAWRYGRVRTIRRWVDRLFVIFPFEQAIYRREGVTHTYVGHPLAAAVRPGEERGAFRRRHGVGERDVLLALLPGSRESEVTRLLPDMLAAAARLRADYPLRAFLLRARNIRPELLAAAGAETGIRVLEQEQGYDLLHAADAVITACGTSTLEAALLGAPFVVLYKVNPLTYFLGHRFLKIGLYSIVNILAGKAVAAELIQGECRPERIVGETRRILDDPRRREEMRAEFRRVAASLQQQERPAAIVCKEMMAELEAKTTNHRDA